ncbi:MAG: LarC family nickel insertion protein [Thermoanaerobaculia bacterium]
MKVLYIDSVGGIAGDMFLGAALDAGFTTLHELQSIVSAWLPERMALSSAEVNRSGMRARTFLVEIDAATVPHRHRHLADVERLLSTCPISPRAREIAGAMFRRLAEAEAKVHGHPLERVHFHEVGATDSLVDFALSALVLDRLDVRIAASPAMPGRGHITMEHGIWPVPPPGTAEVFRAAGIPMRAVPATFPWENAELTTPTGACLLALAERFGDLPAGRVEAIGVGAGTMNIPGFPNVVRLLLVEPGTASGTATNRFDEDRVSLLETWIDDMPGNLLAAAMDEILAAGAYDFAITSATFKKGRVGYRVEVISPLDRTQEVAAAILGRTTSIGLRIRESDRWKLFRNETRMSDGTVGKLVHDADGRIARAAPETDALKERSTGGGAAPMFGWRIEDRSGPHR